MTLRVQLFQALILLEQVRKMFVDLDDCDQLTNAEDQWLAESVREFLDRVKEQP